MKKKHNGKENAEGNIAAYPSAAAKERQKE